MTRVEYQVVIPFGTLEGAKRCVEEICYSSRTQKVIFEYEVVREYKEVSREDVK